MSKSISFLMGLLVFATMALATGAEAEDYASWRADMTERLKAEKSWLSVVGLHWLKEGKNTLGSDFKNDLRLPKRAPKELGYILKKDDAFTLVLKDKSLLKINGRSLRSTTIGLKTDAYDEFSKLQVEDIEFYLIHRKNGTGLRIKDPQSQARKNFTGRRWFDPKKSYALKGQWVAYKSEKTLRIPDVIGNVNEEKISGHIEFEYQGKRHKVYPTGSKEKLFLVFKDATSGKTTYGPARFLYTEVAKDGSVILDFNKAYNPPCAFTDYATCPKAPKENILPFEVKAGELPPVKG